jgi:hypothetical protein
LCFSTGESPVYHTPEDRPETLDYAKLTEISMMIERLMLEAATADTLPTWADEPSHSLDEAVVVRDVLRRLLNHGGQLSLKPIQAGWLKSQIEVLEEAIERGSLTPSERRRMVINAQLVLYSIL